MASIDPKVSAAFDLMLGGVENITRKGVTFPYAIVNGPGESKHADIGISLPGTGEQPTAPVFIDGKKAATLRGATLTTDFKQMVVDYIERRWGTGAAPAKKLADVAG